jgi:sialate O-acetylesterase
MAGLVKADVTLPAIFGDHMVLQRGQKVPFWGTAEPGEDVTVTVGGAKATAKTGDDKKWSLTIESLKESDQPTEVTVAGKNTITLKDVLVGDVWVASGQSNMEFGLKGAHNSDKVIPKADHPTIRLFTVQKKIALDPQSSLAGKWLVCSPASVGGFSAVGYFFARDIAEAEKVPVGMIGTYWGGTPAQAWTSVEALDMTSDTKQFADTIKSTKEKLPGLKEKYEKETLPAWQAAHKQWEEEAGKPFAEATKKWTEEVVAAKAAGKPGPTSRPVLSKVEPRRPSAPDDNPNAPTVLYNGMIAPIIPYAIKGAIWYQGESNQGQPKQYQTLFPLMITDWRTRWAQGDFPFLWVQLANFDPRNDSAKGPTQGIAGWVGLQEAQSLTMKLPNTGQAVINDIGDLTDIHPKNKVDVGHRLALAARHVAYGEDLVYSGPTYDSMTVEGDKLRVKFKNVGSGLAAFKGNQSNPATQPADEVKGFTIAGDDHKFVYANATIDGDTVVVSSPDVKNPMAVRYAWANFPNSNLYNKEKLPASLFRSDDWGDKPVTKPAN